MHSLVLVLSAALAAPAPFAYTAGERMGFGINYLGMRVGTAAITVHSPSESLVPVELEAHTTGITGAVFGFQERLVSHIDPKSGLPGLFVLDIDERGWRHHDTTRYDRPAGKAVLVEKGKTISTKEVPVQPETLDFVALVFKLRSMQLQPGDRHTFSVLSGTKLREVVTEVMTRETVKTRVGEFTTLKIRVPTGFTGKFSERNPTYLWLSDDPARIVVKLATDFSFGSAVAELISYRPGAEGVDGTARKE